MLYQCFWNWINENRRLLLFLFFMYEYTYFIYLLHIIRYYYKLGAFSPGIATSNLTLWLNYTFVQRYVVIHCLIGEKYTWIHNNNNNNKNTDNLIFKNNIHVLSSFFSPCLLNLDTHTWRLYSSYIHIIWELVPTIFNSSKNTVNGHRRDVLASW